VNSIEQEIATLRRRLSDADELVRAIHDGEVDAFVLRYRDSYKVHALQGADTADRVLVEGMRQGAVTIAANGTILYANRRLCEMLGSSPESTVGRSITECFDLDQDTLHAILRSATEGHAPGEFLIRTGEQSIVALISAYPLEAEGPDTVFCLVISDVSDKKAAEKRQAALAEERAELASIFSKLPFAVFVTDPRGGIYYVNEMGEKLAASEGVLGKVRSFASEIKEDEPAEPVEVEVEHGDGSTACYRFYANAVRSPVKAGRAVVVAMDVTHEREARKRRERDDQLRETFVAILGHDLRTPLGTVQVAGDLMKRRASTEQDVKLAEMILRATHRMKGLTDDMLDLASSRLGQGIHLIPVDADLASMVATVTEELSGGGRVDFVIEVAGDVRGVWDPGRMTQVLSNLLGNAVSYGASGKAIRVRVDGTADEEVSIAVTNQGDPIPVDLLPVLFDPFRRGRSAGTKNRRGIGLGLYIADQIVAAHGGRIDVRSDSESGTTFTVRLSRRPCARRAD
jgi:PAS domain S-box-containing protein